MSAEQKAKKERYANIKNKHIAAAVQGLYRFESEKLAVEKLENLRAHFTTAREKEDEAPPKPCVSLWIKDYKVGKAEREKGFMGNYALLTIEKLEDGLFTIQATKLETELKFHPRRKRQPAKMPNPGHPILRSVKKGKTYDTIEEVQADLEKLHLEYPQTTVPAQNKLYLMVFSRKENSKNPVQKYVLEIKNLQGGGFTLEMAKNEYKRSGPPAVKTETKDESSAPMGHFTSMVALKRNKKNPVGSQS